MRLIEHVTKYYRYRLFPKINHLRGTQFLNEKLKNRSLSSEPEIDEREVVDFDNMEWDNLIILDGCRQDLYEEVTGVSQSLISPGSSSSHFTSEVFSKGEWSNTVMITANPHIDKLFEELTGRKSDDVFHTVFRTYKEGWSEELSTVPPEKVVEHALTAEKLFPDKRKIIWFMQPHHPFLGTKLMPDEGEELEKGWDGNTVWQKAGRGIYSNEGVWRGYRKNLENVLTYVDRLRASLEGKTVLTSDHGNLVGEGGLYAHPPERKEKVLRRVPWEVL